MSGPDYTLEEDAILRGARHVAGVDEVGRGPLAGPVTAAAVIMISVFLAFVLSGDRVIAMFGIALAAAVALDAFVLRTLLVPALMHMLGGANWWLPGPLDRLIPRISIEPPDRPAPRAEIPGERTGDADRPVTQHLH